jgi:hypothetical protein
MFKYLEFNFSKFEIKFYSKFIKFEILLQILQILFQKIEGFEKLDLK